jgi:hypothetical protein
MRCPLFVRGIVASALAVVVGLHTSVIHAAAPASKHYTPPRTPDGKPDLQGVWSNASITTLERNSRYKSLVIPPEQVAAATAAHPQVVRQATDDAEDAGTQRLDGSDLARGRGYNAFWIDPGSEFGLVKGERRTSWIIDPVDGKIPYNEQGRKAVAHFDHEKDNFDGPEARPPADRCLYTGGRIGPPMLNGLYNNNYQIVQTHDHVVILIEMVRHARIIPIKHSPAERQHLARGINQLFGDSIGWWEGDTLVVETTQFHPVQANSTVSLSPTARVIERLTRVSNQQILYEFTVDDPVYYAQPWRGELSLNARHDRLYEYACHEGNYAMTGILAGAREEEKAAATHAKRQ